MAKLDSVSVQEKWMMDDDPDAKHIRWSNDCLSCKKRDYQPFSLNLLHYCIDCGIICRACGFAKPLFAYPFDRDSDAYKHWKAIAKTDVRGRPPQEAHIQICNYCYGYELDQIEEAEREIEKERRRKLLENPEAQRAMQAMFNFKG